MKIKRQTFSEFGVMTQQVIIEGTTLKKLALKYPEATKEPNGNIVMVRDGFTIIYSKK